jgi:hypothetical protein
MKICSSPTAVKASLFEFAVIASCTEVRLAGAVAPLGFFLAFALSQLLPESLLMV